MSNVISMAAHANNANFTTPKDALQDAIDSIGKENTGAFEKGKKILILCLDDTDQNYHVTFIQAQMKMSECVTLCEIAKQIFLQDMGY